MLIGQGEDAKVTVYDVEYKKIFETKVPARGKIFITPETLPMRLMPYPEILIKSDKPIMDSPFIMEMSPEHHRVLAGETAEQGSSICQLRPTSLQWRMSQSTARQNHT